MLDITNNNIVTISRGDTVTVPLHLFYGIENKLTNLAFFMNRTDKVYFAVCEPNQSFEDAIIKKIITYDEVDKKNGVIPIKMEGTDTEFLHPGTYYYIVKLLRKPVWKEVPDEEGTLSTVISKTKFIIID